MTLSRDDLSVIKGAALVSHKRLKKLLGLPGYKLFIG